MQLLFSAFLFLQYCYFASYGLTFEILKRSEKHFTFQSPNKEFFFLKGNTDTSKSEFIAQVKLKGDDITAFDLYYKLRQESQNIGANSFRVLKSAKGNDSYYLLCNIYFSDSSVIAQEKRMDPDNGKLFLISPEPLKYLNKDRVHIGKTGKLTLISGTYHCIKKAGVSDSTVMVKGKHLNAITTLNSKEAIYYVTRNFSTSHGSPLAGGTDLIVPTNGGVQINVPLNAQPDHAENYHGSFKNKDGSIEDAFGKFLLLFSQPASK